MLTFFLHFHCDSENFPAISKFVLQDMTLKKVVDSIPHLFCIFEHPSHALSFRRRAKTQLPYVICNLYASTSFVLGAMLNFHEEDRSQHSDQGREEIIQT